MAESQAGRPDQVVPAAPETPSYEQISGEALLGQAMRRKEWTYLRSYVRVLREEGLPIERMYEHVRQGLPDVPSLQELESRAG